MYSIFGTDMSAFKGEGFTLTVHMAQDLQWRLNNTRKPSQNNLIAPRARLPSAGLGPNAQ